MAKKHFCGKIVLIVNIAYNISLAITIFRKSQVLCYIKGQPVYGVQ